MKNILTVIAILVSVVAFGVSAANIADAQEKLVKIKPMQFVGGDTAGNWTRQAAAIADKANEYFEGHPISAVPGGAEGNPLMLAIGKAQIGLSQGPFIINAIEGKAPYEKPIGNVIKAIAGLTPAAMHLIADSKVPADDLADVINKKLKLRMGIPPKGSGSNFMVSIILSELGYSDMDKIEEYGAKIYYAVGGNLNDAWNDRHIDLAFTTYSPPAAMVKQALTTRQGKLLSIDDKLMDVLCNKRGFAKYTIPAKTYPGQDKDINTVALNTIIIVRDDLPEEVVYLLTKATYESKKILESVHSTFKDFTVDQLPKDLPIAMHKGAERFYKEVGLIK